MVNQGVTEDILPALHANYLHEVYCLLVSRLLVHRVIDNFQKIGLTDLLVELQIIIGPILHFLKNKSYFLERQTAPVIKEVDARHVLSRKSAQQPTSNQGKGADHLIMITELDAFMTEYSGRNNLQVRKILC